MSRAVFRVAERIYSEPDARGRRHLLHGAGKRIPWDEAVQLGLVSPDAVPADQLEVRLPVDLHEPDDRTGGRRLVHRAGSVVTLAEAERLGLRIGASGEVEVDEEAEVEKEKPEPKREAPEKPPARRPGAGQPPRTTKQPAPQE